MGGVTSQARVTRKRRSEQDAAASSQIAAAARQQRIRLGKERLTTAGCGLQHPTDNRRALRLHSEEEENSLRLRQSAASAPTRVFHHSFVDHPPVTVPLQRKYRGRDSLVRSHTQTIRQNLPRQRMAGCHTHHAPTHPPTQRTKPNSGSLV